MPRRSAARPARRGYGACCEIPRRAAVVCVAQVLTPQVGRDGNSANAFVECSGWDDHFRRPASSSRPIALATIRSSRSGRPMAPAYELDSPTSILWSPASRRGCVATLAITSRTSLTRGSSNSRLERRPVRGRSSPDQHSGGEHRPQPLLQRSARKRADNSVDLLPVPDHD